MLARWNTGSVYGVDVVGKLAICLKFGCEEQPPMEQGLGAVSLVSLAHLTLLPDDSNGLKR